MKMNKKGFSLVELLAVIVIVGSLAFVAISAVTRYIDRSRKEKVVQDKKNVSMAAQMYLQSNRSLFPKLIGDETRINISELKKKSYLKEDVTNEAGESCMDNSFVRVYKLSETDYSYTTYLYCGNEKAPAEIDYPEPVVKDFKFSGGSRNPDGSFSDVKDAKFSFTMKGAEKNPEIGIYSYSYSIYVRSNDPGAIYTQVYDSESIKGGMENTIKISSKNLSSYMDITGYTNIRVDVSIINSVGKKTDFSETSGDFDDQQAPSCGTREGEATSDNDWINKKSFGDKDAIVSGTRSYPARISVDCNDGSGSGCKRDRFTKSWPNDYESVSGKIDYNLGTRWGYIELEDNATKTNKTKCYVRANIDLQAPEVTVTFYKIAEGGGKGEQVYKYTVKDKNEINATMPSGTVKASDYKDVVGVGSEKWLNLSNYKYGLIMDVSIKDNLYLNSYKWEVNDPLVGEGAGDSKISSTVSDANGVAEQKGGTANKGTFSRKGMKDNPKNDAELAEAEYGALTGSVSGLKLTREGKRYGKLTVCDKANNCTTVHIYANIDRTAPLVPTVSYKKQSSASTSYDPATASNYTDNEHWINDKIHAYIVGQKADAQNDKKVNLSGWQKFTYSYIGQDSSKAKYSWLAAKTGDAVAIGSDLGFSLNNEGVNRIKFRSCDKAGNCSAYNTEAYVKIDLTKPTCDVVKTYNPKSGPNAAGWLKAGQSVDLSLSCADKKSTDSGCNVKHANNLKHTLYNYDINVSNAGAAGVGKGGTVFDYAGNESKECPKNVTVKIDTVKPSCDTKYNYSGTTGPNAAGWLKIGESVTLSKVCTDNKSTGTYKISSGCDTSSALNKRTFKYNVDIKTNQAGAEGNGAGGKVIDIAGNESDACPLKKVWIDHKAPSCSTAISYSQGASLSSGWLGSGETATVKQVCKEASVNGVSSGCSSSVKSFVYKREIKTTKAGAGGDNNGGGKVKDKAGNASANCPADKTVKIDYTAPSCTPSANLKSSGGTTYTGGWTNQTVVLTAKCTERGTYRSGCTANKTLTIDSDVNATFHFKYVAGVSGSDTSRFINGSVQARAVDVAGNYSNCNKDYAVKIDKTQPTPVCSVSGAYYADSNNSFSVTHSGSYDEEVVSKYNGLKVSSGIKAKTFSLDGGSFSTTTSKKLACGSSKRYAKAVMRISDNAGNSGKGGDKTCDNQVTVYGCCDSTGNWVNGNTCYNDKRKKVTCGGGNYDRFKYSSYNGQQCLRENNAGSKCATKSCCSESNYTGCPRYMPCRDGNTYIYTNSNFNLYAGTVRHTSGYVDYLYKLSSGGGKMKVRAKTIHSHYTSQHSGMVVWIYTKCVSKSSSFCSPSQCKDPS